MWVSEGFTNYYGSIAIYRAGLRSREQFVRSVQDAINGIENNEARLYIPPASSSVSTWVGYDTPVAFGISYYTQGQNLAALLDLSILNDTNGGAGLDDVMRALYRDFYQKGKGFTTDDMIGIINRLTKRDYRDFYRKYVFGVEVPAYDEILGYAGYRTEKSSRSSPTIGVGIERSDDGIRLTRVSPGSQAASAGLRVGDLVVGINGTELGKDPQELISKLGENIGHAVKLSIKRGAQRLTSDVEVGTREDSSFKIIETPSATPKQLKIREAWLKTAK